MAYRYGDRCQMTLLPKSIEQYIAEDDRVRAYDAFVEALDFQELGIRIEANKVGNSQYDPKTMVKLYVYGHSYGVKSSRKLERASHHNLSFIWLTYYRTGKFSATGLKVTPAAKKPLECGRGCPHCYN